ncbi:MAG: MtnX-like HAD-IB family phosphatase [Proteobacteria bacterium]|nr:MtnX-like HAD-IB family phosphatase [Pseudomonadota bacterium]
MPLRYLKVSPLSQRKVPSLLPVASDMDFNIGESMVYFDFDNTITTFDVLDGIIEQFSINRDWVAYENAWRAGHIGSKECLEGQLRSIRGTRKTLREYLSTISLDIHFKRLLALLRSKGINPIIVSDSFSFFIEYILRINGVKGLKVYANRIRFYGDRLIPSFPYTNSLCSHCAHCKTNNLSDDNGDREKKIIYIGDGLSDVCPAQHAHRVFAKSTLLDHFSTTQRHCLPFKDLGDVYNYFKEYCNGSETEALQRTVKVSRK